MLPKIATALARVLEPIKPIARPGHSLTLMKSSEGGGGGHGPLGYETPPEDKKTESEPPSAHAAEAIAEDGVQSEHPEKRVKSLPFQPGLTQVILDLQSHRLERNAGNAAQTYETGAKEQKKNARLPKGSMLDKKVG